MAGGNRVRAAAGNHARLRRVAIVATTLCASLGAFAATSAPALAFTPRTYESQLSGELSYPTAVAIDSAADVWVADNSNSSKAIVKFNSSGERLPEYISGENFECQGARIYTADVDRTTDHLYLAESCADLVDSFSSSGALLAQLGPFGQNQISVAVDNSSGPSSGRVYASQTEGSVVNAVTSSGAPVNFTGSATYINANQLSGTPSGPFGGAPFGNLLDMTVNSSGDLFVSDETRRVVDEFEPSGIFIREITGTPGGPFGDPGAVTTDPTNGDLLVVDKSTNVIDEFTSTGTFLAQIDGSETPAKSFSTLGALAISPTGYLYAADSGSRVVDIYSPTVILPRVSAGGVSDGNAGRTAATLNASVDPNGGGAISACRFEYVEKADYAAAAANPFSAGQSVPCSPAPSYTEATKVSGAITGLTPGTTYLYRAVATDAGGSKDGAVEAFTLQPPTVAALTAKELTASTANLVAKINPQGSDTTLRFEYGTTNQYGSSAPIPDKDIGSEGVNQTIEERITNLQVGATYHFRLVATNAYGTTTTADQTFNFYPPSCPNSHLRQITNSSYLPDCRAYELVSPADAGGTTLFPEGPNSATATSPPRYSFGGFLGTIPGAGDPPNNLGDLYVATRTSEGWVSKYVGLHADQADQVNGPPNEPYGLGGYILGSPSGVRATPDLSKFVDWNDGDQGFSEISAGTMVPYVWGSEGEALGVWPTAPSFVASAIFNQSPDFSHYYFESEGKIYDNATAEGTATPISLDSGGNPVAVAAIPGSSTDGSRVLMSTGGCAARVPNACSPGQLYMRVDDTTSFDVSGGHVVQYVGMTPDASEVYFTSEEQLLPEDHDESADLYMWSEASNSLTLISVGSGGSGNSDACSVTWTSKCGVVPYTNSSSYTRGYRLGGVEGNGLSDNAIASSNGDIYFYSPEQLDGEKGVLNQENLYDYRDGHPQYVTTFNTGPFCSYGSECSNGPMVRIQVSPDDSHMAFLTASNVTSYNSAGHLEMYSYDPATEVVACVSCLPSGQPPSSNVEASSNGTFMTNDGRIFFSTSDPLVPRDTDNLRDVYEFVEGQPQLISSGTSSKDETSGIAIGISSELFTAGLAGVSADGENVYFSTYDTLVGQDQNGDQLKIYDARTDGGFPYTPPPAPCQAADECHGPGSLPPSPPQNASNAPLGNLGNVTGPSKKKKHHHRRHHQRSAKRHGRGGRG